VFLLSNCILGSGILGQAYAMRHSGVAVFVVSLLLMASVAAYGVWLLLCCCETTGLTSYEELGTRAFGRWGRGITTAAILMQNASAMTSYLVILGDLLPTLVREAAGIAESAADEPLWANRAALMTAVVLVVIVPLVSLRNIGTLGYSSGLSIVIMVFFACAAAVTASRNLPCPLPAHMLPPALDPSSECAVQAASLGIDTFYVLPSLAFSFVCHTGLLPIYTELRRRDRPTMMRVAAVSMTGCLVLYLVAGEAAVGAGGSRRALRAPPSPPRHRFRAPPHPTPLPSLLLPSSPSGLFGYIAFRGAVSSDSLKSMTSAFPDDPLVTAARILVCVSVTVTVPLINYPARETEPNCDASPSRRQPQPTPAPPEVIFPLAPSLRPREPLPTHPFAPPPSRPPQAGP